jgi:hypothetical protein
MERRGPMRAHFGGYFFGQVATFIYLTQVMQTEQMFNPAQWPQFSLYNLLVANFWPLYWVAHVLDDAKVNETYWHIFTVAQDKVAGVFHLVAMLSG